MEISSTGVLCDGEPVSNGFVMANPGKTVTIFSDTDCDGENDAFVDVDTSQRRLGDVRRRRQLHRRRRLREAAAATTRRSSSTIDRAWDGKWAMNAAYTLAFSRGNAEGPVNTDTDFGDTGRTENFDDPWVNFGGYGYLPNDHRHQLKLRGTYGFARGLARRRDAECAVGPADQRVRHRQSVRRHVVPQLLHLHGQLRCPETDAQYELLGRGSQGRTPWTYDVGANITWQHQFGPADMLVKLAVYNLLNEERVLEVDESYNPTERLDNHVRHAALRGARRATGSSRSR